MNGQEYWDGCGSAVPAHPDLHGVHLFDSPLSEMNEMDLGDDILVTNDFFEGDTGSMHFDLDFGGFPAASESAGSLDMNAQLAACFDFNDPLLYPDTDMAFPLDSMMDFSSFDASPFSRTSDTSALTAATSPGSAAEAGTANAHPHHCTTDGCTKTFRKESQLKQHQRVHKKSLVCPICRAERQTEHKFAQVRDLERHLQARHRDVAERANVRSETRACPFAGCDHRGRRDNVSRHYESKHGGKLKWRKGVPSVV